MSKGKPPLIIGHRGNSGVAPANTMESIRQAVALGVDMIELDVRQTRDRVLILIHNDTLDETTNGKGLVSDMDYANIKELDAGSWKNKIYAGERIPTLMEALDFARGKVCLSLDLKDEAVIPAMLNAIKDADMVDGVVVCGCCEPQAKAIWDLNKNITVVLNTDSKLDELAKCENKTDFIREYIHRACRERFSALNVSYRFVTEELIYQAHLRGLPVWTWTVDNISDMERLINMGVDAIYSNFPERLLQACNH
jgi:glycerophosphoryl diester phosphodiesterase